MITIYKKNNLSIDDNYIDYILQFVKFTTKLLNIGDDINIYLIGKGQDNQSTTGGYNLNNKTITALYEGRALIDILRTIAHELEHQRQDNLNLIGNNPQNVGGFLENDANIIAGILIKLFIKWTDDRNIYFM